MTDTVAAHKRYLFRTAAFMGGYVAINLAAIFEIGSGHVRKIAPLQRHKTGDALTQRPLDLRRAAHSA